MLNHEERSRLGELNCRTDRSVEEEREFQELLQRARGNQVADFLSDTRNFRLTPNSPAAKQRMPSTFAPHEREPFDNQVEQLKREGYTVREVAAIDAATHQ